jgi:rRNA maturation endonuclease Nob1
MGFFKRVGRQVEQFTQSAKQVAADDADYRCADCDGRFHTEQETCPECGGDTVEAGETT